MLFVIVDRVSAAARLLRDARHASGLTQAQLAERLGTSQPRIAQLESNASNPRLDTLERAIAATGHRLQLYAPSWGSGVDASLVREHLSRTPAQRLAVLDELHEQADWLAGARRV